MPKSRSQAALKRELTEPPDEWVERQLVLYSPSDSNRRSGEPIPNKSALAIEGSEGDSKQDTRTTISAGGKGLGQSVHSPLARQTILSQANIAQTSNTRQEKVGLGASTVHPDLAPSIGRNIKTGKLEPPKPLTREEDQTHNAPVMDRPDVRSRAEESDRPTSDASQKRTQQNSEDIHRQSIATFELELPLSQRWLPISSSGCKVIRRQIPNFRLHFNMRDPEYCRMSARDLFDDISDERAFAVIQRLYDLQMEKLIVAQHKLPALRFEEPFSAYDMVAAFESIMIHDDSLRYDIPIL